MTAWGYPLAIPDGAGLTIPIQLFGDLGFYNLHSALVLVVPIAAMDVVTAQLAAEIPAGTRPGTRRGMRRGRGCASGRAAEFAVRLKAVPLGGLGEIGVEAGRTL